MKALLAFLPFLASSLIAQCTARPAEANQISISCQAPAAQAENLVRILNRVISARLNPETVLSRLDTLETRSASEPRVLTAADLDRLRRALAPFRGQKVSLAYAAADLEASQLADQLDTSLRRAGWVQPAGMISAGATARGESPGIDLTVAERTRASDALWNALLAAGLDVVAHINPAAIRDGSISMFVYSRR